MGKKAFLPVLGLVLGHLVTDLQGGALPIVLPHLKEIFALSYSQLAAIVLTQNITSSVIQPLFGYLTDKKSLPQLLPYCAALAGAGFAAVGWVSSYEFLLLAVIFIGIASATYHPQASKTVNFLSTKAAKAKNMGLFSLGGNAGMAFGSLGMAFLISLPGGLHNTIYFLLPGLVVFGLMLKCMPAYIQVNQAYNNRRQAAEVKHTDNNIPYLGLLFLLLFIFLRSTIHTGLSTYLPLFFMKFRSCDSSFASMLVSGFLLGGVAGTYIGAVLSDRLGARKIILGSIVCSIPAIWLINLAVSPVTALAAVIMAGFAIIGSFATTIILAQSLLPNNVGMAAGLTIGFSVGMGGFGVTLLGILADNWGLPLVMQLITWLPVAAAIIAVWIPIPAELRKR